MTNGTGGPGAYVEVLRSGRVARPFAAAVVARLPISMAPLGIVLLVQESAGSYAEAGVVAGAYAVGVGAGSPVWGRAIDRLGQSRVAAPTVATSAVLLAAFALVTAAGAGLPVVLALALAAGATAPPFSSAMRVTWRAVLPRERWRTGYALDASAVEAVFVGGPLLLSLLLPLTPPAGPLLVTAVLHATGGLLYAASEPARRPPEAAAPVDGPLAAEGRPATSLLGAALVAVLVVGLVVAVAFGFVDTSLVATAREVLHDESLLGVLFAAIAGGSVTGGLVYGVLPGSPTERRRLPVLLAGFATGLGALALLLGREDGAPLAVLLPVLFATGLLIAPGLILLQALVDALSPDGRRAEGQAWLSTATVAGGAGGTALAGVAVEVGGPASALGAASAAVAVAAVLAVLAQPAWGRRTDPASARAR